MPTGSNITINLQPDTTITASSITTFATNMTIPAGYYPNSIISERVFYPTSGTLTGTFDTCLYDIVLEGDKYVIRLKEDIVDDGYEINDSAPELDDFLKNFNAK